MILRDLVLVDSPWSSLYSADMEYECPRVYFLPNVMTGVNLICGFSGTLSIMHGCSLRDGISEKVFFGWAIAFIMAAGVFDFLDGQVARFCGQESTFGREFDSLADLVSFGVAPALLVYRVVLEDFPHAGLVLAAIYLLSCALRLARFNCTAAAIVRTDTRRTLVGFPVPSAAGLIASLAWLSLSRTADGYEVFTEKWLLPPLTLFVSLMMLSNFSYPTIGVLDLRTRHPILKLIAIGLVLATGTNHRSIPALLFTGYLLYGVLRPHLSIKLRARVPQRRAPTVSDELHSGGT